MSKSLAESQTVSRDGTSQADRRQKALEPDYVSVDERSLEDLLSFARAYAGELKYYNEQNEDRGDWSAFLSPGADLEQVVAYMQNPEEFPPEKTRQFARPHFALLLGFLQLLRHAQAHLNTFTRRHLDFYYQAVLQMAKKAAVPDRVNVVMRPAAGVRQVEVPQGSWLAAGQDSLGRDRVYGTDRRIIVNRAQIARLSSVYAERQVTGIREARERYPGTRTDAFLNMLRIALGDPLPGDPIPEYEADKPVDYETLLGFEALVNFAHMHLFVEFFELRSLMTLKQRRDQAGDEWKSINAFLEKAVRARSGNPDFTLAPADARDFDANLAKAMGGKPSFAGLPQVETIVDLYDQRIRQDVQDYIRDRLHFESFDDFVGMMQIKVRIDNEWKQINRILELAGQRKRDDPAYRLQPEAPAAFDPTDFEVNLNAAVGPVDFAALTGIANIGLQNSGRGPQGKGLQHPQGSAESCAGCCYT